MSNCKGDFEEDLPFVGFVVFSVFAVWLLLFSCHQNAQIKPNLFLLFSLNSTNDHKFHEKKKPLCYVENYASAPLNYEKRKKEKKGMSSCLWKHWYQHVEKWINVDHCNHFHFSIKKKHIVTKKQKTDFNISKLLLIHFMKLNKYVYW